MGRVSWLFEAPLPLARPSADPLASALAEWGEGESRRTFRKRTLASIGDPRHPLNFLVTKLGKYTNLKNLRVDAGHVIPARTLKKHGWTTERFTLQDRAMNRSDGGRMGATRPARRVVAIDVAGVPVEEKTLLKWIAYGWLAGKYGTDRYRKAYTIRHREGEIGYALGEAGAAPGWS